MIKFEEYFTKKIITNITKTLEKSKGYIQDIWMASNEHILNIVNNKIELFFNDSLVEINSIEQDSEYDGFYEKIDFKYNNKNNKINMVWKFIYSYLNESIIIIGDNEFIVGYVSIDDWNLVFSNDDDGIPLVLEAVNILVPKENLYFERKKIYDVVNKTKNTRLKIKSGEFSILMSVYLKKLNR